MCKQECDTYLLGECVPKANMTHGQKMKNKMPVDKKREISRILEPRKYRAVAEPL